MKQIKEVIDRYAKDFDVISNLSEDALEKHHAGFIEIYAFLCRAHGALRVNPDKQIFLTAADLRLARMEEIEKGFALGKQQAIVKRAEGNIAGRQIYIVAAGYAKGIIDGKNAEIRKSQEKQLMADDGLLITMEREAADVRSETSHFVREMEEAKVNRKYLEDFLSAQRAVLIYSGRDEEL